MLHAAAYVPLCGSSHIPTPKKLVRRKGVLNVKNDDAKCFVWSILAGIHPVNHKDNPNPVSKFVQYMHELVNWRPLRVTFLLKMSITGGLCLGYLCVDYVECILMMLNRARSSASCCLSGLTGPSTHFTYTFSGCLFDMIITMAFASSNA